MELPNQGTSGTSNQLFGLILREGPTLTSSDTHDTSALAVNFEDVVKVIKAKLSCEVLKLK